MGKSKMYFNKNLNNKIRLFLYDFLLMNIGCLLLGIGTSLFLLPNKLSNGGFSGIATLIYYFLNIPMSTSIIVLNIPFFIIGYRRCGRDFFFKSIYSTLVYSYEIDYFIFLFLKFNFLQIDSFLSSVYGGILVGAGVALSYKSNSSTGGTDLIAHIIRSYTNKVKTGEIVVYIDFLVVLLNLIVFKNLQIGLYSWIVIYVVGKMIDIVFEGLNFCKVIYIISDEYRKIGEAIIKETNKGATSIYSKGLYLNKDKEIIMCIVKRNDVVKIKNLSKKLDRNSFIIVTDAREVYGLGFKM